MAEINGMNGAETLEHSSEEIRQDILEKLESLSKTINQLGGRMHETFNWHEQAARHPYIIRSSGWVWALTFRYFQTTPNTRRTHQGHYK